MEYNKVLGGGGERRPFDVVTAKPSEQVYIESSYGYVKGLYRSIAPKNTTQTIQMTLTKGPNSTGRNSNAPITVEISNYYIRAGNTNPESSRLPLPRALNKKSK